MSIHKIYIIIYLRFFLNLHWLKNEDLFIQSVLLSRNTLPFRIYDQMRGFLRDTSIQEHKSQCVWNGMLAIFGMLGMLAIFKYNKWIILKW